MSAWKWMFLSATVAALMACSGDERRGGVQDAGASDDAFEGDAALPEGDTAPVVPGGPRTTDGPGAVLDVDKAQDPLGLNLEIRIADSGLQPVSAVGSEVYRIEFGFRSQTTWGSPWNHQATLYVPLKLNEAAVEGAFVILPPGTANEVSNVSTSEAYRNNYATRLTAVFGIPTLVVTGLPGTISLQQGPASWAGLGPSECYGASLAPRNYVPCLLTILSATGDLEADPFRLIAYAFMRTVTAAEQVARQASTTSWRNEGPIEFTLSRAIILADDERAVGARMAAAIDERIDGVFGAADFGALPTLVETIESAWQANYGWFRDPSTFAVFLGTEAGQAWRQSVDPTLWPHLIAEKHFVNAGATNHPLFPLSAVDEALGGYPLEANRLVVNDYGAGFGTQAHLSSWYALVTKAYLGRPWLRVSATATRSGSNFDIVARGEGASAAQTASLASIQQHQNGDDRDFRDAIWVTQGMTPGTGGDPQGQTWTGRVAPIVTHGAGFVTVGDAANVPTIFDDPAEVSVPGFWSSPILFFD